MALAKTFNPSGNLMACEFVSQKQSRGGIILPDIGSEDITASAGEVQRAIVVAIGPEVRYYRPGDIILLRRGTFLKHEGHTYAMIEEDETFGCVNRELERLPPTSSTTEIDPKLKKMIHEDIAQIVASYLRSKQ